MDGLSSIQSVIIWNLVCCHCWKEPFQSHIFEAACMQETNIHYVFNSHCISLVLNFIFVFAIHDSTGESLEQLPVMQYIDKSSLI